MSAEPETDDVLYHYCSNAAFLSIVEKNEIWLSDLSLSNDSMEGIWASNIIDKFVKEHVPKSTPDFINKLIKDCKVIGFCLSEKCDLLSQWRGYADNGSGISLGFRKESLDIPVETTKPMNPFTTVRKVNYSNDCNESIHGLIGDFLYQDMAPEGPNQFIQTLYSIKNAAFSEETEWRIISSYSNNINTDSSNSITNMEFRASHDKIIPYRTLDLTTLDQPIIKRVILGPRNITPISVIEGFLAKHGHHDVEVVPSTASYR